MLFSIHTVGAALLTLGSVVAIDCSVKELVPFDFQAIKGIHSVSTIKDTPPSHTNITWSFGICQSINDEVANCPKNSDVCGITSITFEKDPNPQVYEIIGFNSNLQKSYESTLTGDNIGVTIKYTGANWGNNLVNAELNFVCPGKDDSKDDLDRFVLDKWDNENLKATMRTKAACVTSEGDKTPPSKTPDKSNGRQPDNGESWGWFTWIFIFLVLFLSIYIVGGAWFQYNKGNAIDFSTALREVLDNFIDLLKGLPSFSREIIEKFTGNHNRGEYSAV
ncbi:autophagy-related protein 27 [Scheffersomyces coipomensis]|uniref:autophagy-related protein 27 n=1 Tax=Scheffersomyces coipomensis TaxID=1788519 RepID=UPI00315D3B4B